jgi:hypothetical protein
MSTSPVVVVLYPSPLVPKGDTPQRLEDDLKPYPGDREMRINPSYPTGPSPSWNRLLQKPIQRKLGDRSLG